VVDEKGDAYVKRILDKMKKQEAAWLARGGG
jgi:hypothetical protein